MSSLAWLQIVFFTAQCAATCVCPFGEFGTPPECVCVPCEPCSLTKHVRLNCGGGMHGICDEGCKVNAVEHALTPPCAENLNTVPLHGVCSLRCEAGYDPSFATKTCVSAPHFDGLACNQRCTAGAVESDLNIAYLTIDDTVYKSGQNFDMDCSQAPLRVGSIRILCNNGKWQLIHGRCYYYTSEFEEWSACSVTCGPGTRERKLICHQASTGELVDAQNCVDEGAPETRQQDSCNDPCPLPFYRPGPWGECQGSCNREGSEVRTINIVWQDCDECVRDEPESRRTCRKECDAAVSVDNVVGDDLHEMFALTEWSVTVSFLVSVTSVEGILLTARNVSNNYFADAHLVGVRVAAEQAGSLVSVKASYQDEALGKEVAEGLSAEWKDSFFTQCVLVFDEESCVITELVFQINEKPTMKTSDWELWYTLLIAGVGFVLVSVVTCWILLPRMRVLRKKKTTKRLLVTEDKRTAPEIDEKEHLLKRYEDDMRYFAAEIRAIRQANGLLTADRRAPCSDVPKQARGPPESAGLHHGKLKITRYAPTSDPHSGDHSEWRKPHAVNTERAMMVAARAESDAAEAEKARVAKMSALREALGGAPQQHLPHHVPYSPPR